MENKVLKAGAAYTVGNVLIKGIAFVSVPVFTRLMSTYDYGMYSTYISYEAIIAILIGFGLHASIKNASLDYPNDIRSYVNTQIVATFLISLITVFFIVFFSDPIKNFTGFPTSVLLFLIAQSFGQAMLNIENARLALSYEYNRYLIFAAFNTVLNISLSILFTLTLFSNNKLVGRTLGSMIPLTLIGIFVMVTNCCQRNYHLKWDYFKYSFKFGFPLIWHYLAQQVQSQFDCIMIRNLVDASKTGIYSFTYSIANIFTILFYSSDNVWSVWFYKKLNNREISNIKKSSDLYIYLMTGIAVVMMVFSRELLMIIGPRDYWEGINLFIPIIIGMYFLFLYTLPAAIEYYYKMTQYIAATTIIAAVVNIVTNYIFINIFGYVAAAFTTAFSYMLMFILHWIISRKISLKYSNIIVYRFKSFGIGISIVITSGILIFFLNPYPVIKYILSFITALVFLCANRKFLKSIIDKHMS